MYDEIIESYDDETKFNEKRATCKTQNFYIWLPFSLITIPLLIAVTIYCYLVKYRRKQNHLLPFHFKNSKLKEIIYQKWVIKDIYIKDIDIKNRIYYFFDDIVNVKIFGSNNIKIDEKSYKNILISYI